MSQRLEKIFSLVDQQNQADPNLIDGQPLAQYQGRRASRWLKKLDELPSEELQIAARAHHLQRWELKRTEFPEGRAGYLKWRRQNKEHQAAATLSLMKDNSFDPFPFEDSECARVQQLLLRKNLATDPETQRLEDVACLVFLETQFSDVANSLNHKKMVSVVQKTLKKMSPEGVAAAAEIEMTDKTTAILEEAIASMDSTS